MSTRDQQVDRTGRVVLAECRACRCGPGGEVFAGYTVERELRSGGMGSVYLVRHPRLPRFDALKLLRAELCDDPAFVRRFEREADTVAQLDHPNIVAGHDRGSQDGQLWISMR